MSDLIETSAPTMEVRMAKTTMKSKQMSNAKAVDTFKQALRTLKIKPSEVFAHREYSDRIVIVTKAGQKHIWVRGK